MRCRHSPSAVTLRSTAALPSAGVIYSTAHVPCPIPVIDSPHKATPAWDNAVAVALSFPGSWGAGGAGSRLPSHGQEAVWGCHPAVPQPLAAAAHRPALASHVTRECSKKILVSLNNSDSSVVHVGRIVSRLSARAEREDCGTMLLEGGRGWGVAEL